MKDRIDRVIDLKEEKLMELQMANDEVFGTRSTHFEIGHTVVSKTFIPNMLQDINNKDYLYVDMPGLLDNRGDICHILNSFIHKQVFQIAKRIKFIIPITREQISVGRGKEIIE